MSNMTFAQKALARAAGKDYVEIGEIVNANVDVAMMDDILGPRIEIAEGLKELGVGVWDKSKVVVISDHYTPPCEIKQAEAVKFTKDWSLDHGVDYHEYEGPCHQVLAEACYNQPGALVVGTDSHTCMSGAFGAFGTGIGSTEMLGVAATGQIWLKVPESFRIEWRNTLGRGVFAKDMVLFDCRAIGHSGATYKALEYCGEAVSALSMDERMAISNMAVEMGAKAGYIPPDEKTLEYLRAHDLADLKKKAEATGAQEDAQAYNDFANLCSRFEKKLHDLELTRMISVQMGPQTRLLQNNDTQMLEKIQSSLVNTIPLWKSQMVLALGMEHGRQATAAQSAVTEMTNELLKKNADMLKMGTIQTAKEAERSVVSIETLQHTNQQLISTLDEVLNIQREGAQKRKEAEVELGRIEGELRAKLMELHK